MSLEMNMDRALTSSIPPDARLLIRCYREAEKAGLVAYSLDLLRAVLAEALHGHMVAVAEEVRTSARLLRELADRAHVHAERAPVALSHLDILLPCLGRSLDDMKSYYEDKTLTRENRWRKMYNDMTEEAGGLQLPQRFILYNHFLTLLKQLLTRSTDFDPNTLELLKSRIIALREKRGIAEPPILRLGQATSKDLMLMPPAPERNVHWAEQIFSLPLPSRTALKHLRPSKAYGPFYPWSAVGPPPDAKILFRRPFNDQVTVTAFIHPATQSAYLLLQTSHAGQPLFSVKGVHELCISRDGSALQLKRWSQSEKCSKLWAVFYFLTWEEMVLFYCTFVSLKAHNTQTIQVSPDEYKLSREKRLFQAQIIDDRFKHSLIVYEDMYTGGLRLHAAVWEGELRQCPVWTAFITHQSKSPSWLSRRTKHTVWLRDAQLYVFCQPYRHENMRQNKAGAFEIYFSSVEGATRFQEVFNPASTPESSDANAPTSSSADDESK